jgi:tripartite-type tricarboxylate transporter receptor subunit TctC
MVHTRRIVMGGLFAALIVPTAFQPSVAQTAWPSQPLKIIVPFAPGGSSDFIARLIAKPLGDALKTTVIVENRAGNAGNVGAAFTAQATDQHTVMLSDVGSIAISALVVKDLAYKISDLKGVAMLGYSPHLLALNPSVPANSLKELVELSKKKRINVASAGSGSPNHLGVVEIALATGLQWQHVPYKGGAQAMADTIGGNTDIVLNGMLATMPHVQGGKLKAIAVSKRTRVSGLPNVPTVAEQGVAGFESGTYQGVTVAASMPKEHVAKLNAELLRIMNSPEIKKRMEDAGAEVMTSTPEEITEFLNKEKVRWETVISRAGANIEGTP